MDPSSEELAQIAASPSPLLELLNFIGMDSKVESAVWIALGGVAKCVREERRRKRT